MKTKFFRKNKFPSWRNMKLGRTHRFAPTAYCYCLLLLFLWPVTLAAQNGITLSRLVVDAGTVTFNVSWKNTDMPAIWSDTVWVWVDYNTAGTMPRLPLAPGATLTTHTAPDDVGKVIEVPGNDQGVWVVGNARSAGSFSAKVKLLGATANFSVACAYASNYPPVGQYTTATNITFRGTRPHDVLLKHTNGSSTVTQVAGGSLTIPAGYTLQSFTDKTGAPGVITCAASAVYDLKASATEFCTGSTVTFALSNTATGRTYQLYKGSTLVNMLTGTGGAATFTGAFAGAGIYTAQVVTENGYCAAAMTGTHTVNATSLPAAPTGASANKRCGSGAVTFSATAPGGCTIDWYTTSTGSVLASGGSGVTSFAPTIYANTTYYAQARNTTTGCVSATRLAVSGTVNSAPAAPSGASSNARCGSGIVTFSATAPGGCTIDWYTTSTGSTLVSGGSGVTSFSPSITKTTTYYAQARNTSTSCVSSTRLAVTSYTAPVRIRLPDDARCDSHITTCENICCGAINSSGKYTLGYSTESKSCVCKCNQ